MTAPTVPSEWDRTFRKAEEILGAAPGVPPSAGAREIFEQLIDLALTRDPRAAALAKRWLDLADLLAVRRRMIGTGLVGGKALGVLLARGILAHQVPRLAARLEPHESWFVGTDVFSAFVRDGAFPESVRLQLAGMLEAIGTSPIVVRSSSLLESGFESAFAGKYASVFCANQGTPDERLEELLAALRRVYASAMGEEALRYREHRGLLDREEQMAILVQTVSGARSGDLFFPEVSGVGLSYNPWVWSREIDPRAGVARIVFGLGTRAVNRADDDHARLVALGAPALRPGSHEGAEDHSQRRVDVIDLAANRLASLALAEVSRRSPEAPMDLVATRRRGLPPVLTFDRLLEATPFASDLRAILYTLEGAYGSPVHVEFTLNVSPGSGLRLNVLQCRPLQVKEGGTVVSLPADLPDSAVILASRGPVVGRSTHAPIDRVILVVPGAYGRLAAPDRHEVARVVGRATRLQPPRGGRILLLGPGRWGSRAIFMGVPVTFPEIQGVAAVGEIVTSGASVVPDVSLGSHFFDDLVEADMLYLAVDPNRAGDRFAEAALGPGRNRLPELLPADARMADVVRVVDFADTEGDRLLWLYASCIDQRVVCYLGPTSMHTRPR